MMAILRLPGLQWTIIPRDSQLSGAVQLQMSLVCVMVALSSTMMVQPGLPWKVGQKCGSVVSGELQQVMSLLLVKVVLYSTTMGQDGLP